MRFACMYVFVLCMDLRSWKVALDALELELWMCMRRKGFWVLNSGPLQDQQLLLQL